MGGLHQPEDGAGGGGFARTALADDGQGFARHQVEIDAIDGVHGGGLAEQPLTDGEAHHQPLDADYRRRAVGAPAHRYGQPGRR